MNNPYMRLLRPFTLIAAIIAGILLYVAIYHTFDVYAILCGFILALLQGGGQAYNQSVKDEIEIDRLNGKTYRPVVSGEITPEQARLFAIIILLIAVFLSATTYNILFTFITVVGAFLAWQYTDYPIRAKRFFLINNIWQAVARGFIPFILICSIGYNFDIKFILLGLIVMIWITGMQTSKDFGDVEGDRAFNIKTIPVVLDRKKARVFMFLVATMAFILLLVFVMFDILPYKYLYLMFLYIPTMASILLAKTDTDYEIWKGRFENNLGWALFYITLGLWYLGVFVVEVML